MQGAGVCLKNCNAIHGKSASPQTKVRIWQMKYVESQMNGLPLQFLRHISNRTKDDILLAKENFWKFENVCEREEKVITLSAN
jgi:hypothetical protein